jgi:hypothetical protein
VPPRREAGLRAARLDPARRTTLGPAAHATGHAAGAQRRSRHPGAPGEVGPTSGGSHIHVPLAAVRADCVRPSRGPGGAGGGGGAQPGGDHLRELVYPPLWLCNAQCAEASSLADDVSAGWSRYYSWAIPGANSRWGGPGGSTAPKQPFRQEQVHPAALWHFGNLYLSSPQLRSLSEEDSPLYQPPPAADLSRIDLGYCPSQPSVLAHDYRWGRYETEEQTAARVGSTANRRCMQHLGQTVVAVTHGGPSSAALEYLTGATAPIEVCGYTGLHVLTIEDSTDADGAGGAWTAHVQGDVAHIGTGNAGLSTAGRAAKL